MTHSRLKFLFQSSLNSKRFFRFFFYLTIVILDKRDSKILRDIIDFNLFNPTVFVFKHFYAINAHSVPTVEQ